MRLAELSSGSGPRRISCGEFGPGSEAARPGLTVECELGDAAGIAYSLGANAFLVASQQR